MFVENRLYEKPYWMKKRIDTDEGRRIDSHRMWVVEPVFGNITIQKEKHMG